MKSNPNEDLRRVLTHCGSGNITRTEEEYPRGYEGTREERAPTGQVGIRLQTD